MNYELSSKEKKIIVDNRLNELTTDFSRSGTDVALFTMQCGDVCLSMVYNSGQADEKAMSVSISDEDANKVYEFLKNRHELKRELKFLNEPAKDICPKPANAPVGKEVSKQSRPFI